MDYRELAQEIDTAITDSLQKVDLGEIISECVHEDICPFHEESRDAKDLKRPEDPERVFLSSVSDRLRYSSNQNAQALGKELFLMLG